MKAKYIKRATMVCVAVVYLLLECFSMVGCAIGKPKHTEDFYYYYTTGRDVNNASYTCIAIGELTEIGKTKEVIVIPTEIDGYPVRRLYYHFGAGKGGTVFESDVLKKIYVPVVSSLNNTFKSCPALKKVIGYYEPEDIHYSFVWYKELDNETKAYFKSVEYDSKNRDGVRFKGEETHINEYFANVSFMYNYDTSVNISYYFIDDYDYGSKIEYIPEVPTRAGYTFGGWYKEEECINEWDFNTDTLPNELTEENEEGETIVIYQETRLYAKWTEK